jgi:hypothetical protein
MIRVSSTTVMSEVAWEKFQQTVTGSIRRSVAVIVATSLVAGLNRFSISVAAACRVNSYPFPTLPYSTLSLGQDDAANRVLGALFQSMTCLLVFGLSRQLFGDPWVSAKTGVLMAFLPENILEFLGALYPAIPGHLVILPL